MSCKGPRVFRCSRGRLLVNHVHDAWRVSWTLPAYWCRFKSQNEPETTEQTREAVQNMTPMDSHVRDPNFSVIVFFSNGHIWRCQHGHATDTTQHIAQAGRHRMEGTDLANRISLNSDRRRSWETVVLSTCNPNPRKQLRAFCEYSESRLSSKLDALLEQIFAIGDKEKKRDQFGFQIPQSLRINKPSTMVRKASFRAHRTLGMDHSALDAIDDNQESSTIRRVVSKLSFNKDGHSLASRWKNLQNAEGSTPASERAPIPTMMQTQNEVYATPLPVLSMIVLSIVSLIRVLIITSSL